jgi:hypothetical protein
VGDASGTAGQDAARVVRDVLADLGLPWQERQPGLFSVSLPGTAKLVTECALEVGRYGLGARAFVARQPDENHVAVYRWLLERNLKLRTVCFSLDVAGDIYLTGTLPVAAVSPAALDTLLGEVASTADAAFNPILELGFASSITREWAWRRSRGESTANLAAFAHLAPPELPEGATD